MTRPIHQLLLVLSMSLVAAACGDDIDTAAPPSTAATEPVTITLVTHDSFAVTGSLLDDFTAETGITVELLASGDTGQMVSQAILSTDNPLADVMFGIDNTFLQRALDAEIFEPHESPGLSSVPDALELDDQYRVTPIDFGDVCVNYWIDELPADAPTTLADLADPAYANELVVQNPETSSPGLAFLLATISGTADWEQYWTDLRANGVSVTSGWEEAYYGDFIAGGGDRSMVVSYASSPSAEVMFAAEPTDVAPTGVLLDSCYRQIEFAGILAGTDHPEAAARLIDWMLEPAFQSDVPGSMFVFPASEDATLPQEFIDHAVIADEPHLIDPAEIEANRDEWTDRWVEIVLG